MTGKTPNPNLFVLLSIGALLAGGGLCYWQFDKAGEVHAQVQKARTELGSKRQLEVEADESKRRVEESLGELMHLEASVSTVEYVPTLLKDLQATGESCNLQIIGVRPVAKTEKKSKDKSADTKKTRQPYQDLDIEVKCRGSFWNVMKFLKKLEDFPKIVGIRHISITPKIKTETRSLEAIEATLRIRVYVFPRVNLPVGLKEISAADSLHGRPN